MSKKLFLYLFGVTVLFISELSHAKKNQWSWYYTSFLANDTHEVFNRYGWAEIKKIDDKVTGYLVEERDPQVQFPFEGSIVGGVFTIQLPTLFPSYSIEMTGVMRAMVIEGCEYEEILLQYSIPNGEVLVMTKETGDCS
jgi:hypothetical protein